MFQLFLVLSLQMYRFCILAGLLAVAWAQVRTVHVHLCTQYDPPKPTCNLVILVSSLTIVGRM